MNLKYQSCGLKIALFCKLWSCEGMRGLQMCAIWFEF